MFYYLDSCRTYINLFNITAISPAENDEFWKVKMNDGDFYIVPDMEAYQIRLAADKGE